MSSFFKGILHPVLTGLIMWLPLAHVDALNLTIGGVISIAASWALSHFFPTTTGASVHQG